MLRGDVEDLEELHTIAFYRYDNPPEDHNTCHGFLGIHDFRNFSHQLRDLEVVVMHLNFQEKEGVAGGHHDGEGGA